MKTLTTYHLYFYIPDQKEHNCHAKLKFDNPNDEGAIKFAETFRLPEHTGFMIFLRSKAFKYAVPIATWKKGGETRIIRRAR